MDRSGKILGLVVASLVAVGAFAPPVASAQARRGHWWLGMGVEAADARLILRTAHRASRPSPEESFVFGIRLSAEHLVLTRLSVEVTASGQQHLLVGVPMFEAGAAVRYWAPVGPRSTFYLRPMTSFALAGLHDPQAGFGFGFSLGYRRVQSRTMERFVELAYRVRVFPNANPRFADSTFPDYGYHPEDAVTLFASFLGVVGGVGFGPFPNR